MREAQSWKTVGLLVTLVAGGCTGGEQEASKNEPESLPKVPPAVVQQAAPRPVTPVDSAEMRARIAARRDSVEIAFRKASNLRAREVAELRQDVNAEQIAAARSLGRRVSGEAEIEQLRREGRLVALGDSTAYWVLRDMDHSVPYVTPDARAMLVHLGRRFHARLDSLGLPRYRMKVTSALRTDETQADLRKINSYASRIVSAHEFGTTMDVSHERFAVPAMTQPMAMEMLEEIGKQHGKVLQAELGRAILDFKNQGVLRVMMENRQPVYHMTVARRFPPAE